MKFSLAVLALACYNQVSAQENCCDVIELAAGGKASDGSWTVTPTLYSPYEVTMSATQFCDFVEIRSAIVGTNYTVLGKRIFENPHPEEQPFSRDINAVLLPGGTNTITAVGHDSVNGYCGETLTLTLEGDVPTVISAPPAAPSASVPVGTMVTSTIAPLSAAPASSFPVATSNTGLSELPSSTPSALPSSLDVDSPSSVPSWSPSSIPSVLGQSQDGPAKAESPTSYAIRAEVGALAFVTISLVSLLL
jgi:hypothetical protein